MNPGSKTLNLEDKLFEQDFYALPNCIPIEDHDLWRKPTKLYWKWKMNVNVQMISCTKGKTLSVHNRSSPTMVNVLLNT